VGFALLGRFLAFLRVSSKNGLHGRMCLKWRNLHYENENAKIVLNPKFSIFGTKIVIKRQIEKHIFSPYDGIHYENENAKIVLKRNDLAC